MQWQWCQKIPGVIEIMNGMAYQADHLTIGHTEKVSVRKQAGNGKVDHLRGLGSVSKEERDSITLNIERAGDHWFLSISMQTAPRSDMFMWYILGKEEN